ncbi:hypothetical protein BDR07DRAFT_1379252 [Suillus spraguei]|nr:hypothetical protein BDR07DRAFT_1379252 [Suillus spraguei]
MTSMSATLVGPKSADLPISQSSMWHSTAIKLSVLAVFLTDASCIRLFFIISKRRTILPGPAFPAIQMCNMFQAPVQNNCLRLLKSSQVFACGVLATSANCTSRLQVLSKSWGVLSELVQVLPFGTSSGDFPPQRLRSITTTTQRGFAVAPSSQAHASLSMEKLLLWKLRAAREARHHKDKWSMLMGTL